jgi:hypothetical protein
MDTRAKLYGADGSNEREILADGYGSLNVNIASGIALTTEVDGVYTAGNTDPDNIGIVVHQNNATPGDAQQTVRVTGGVSADTIATNTFTGVDTRSKLYAADGSNEREILADGYGSLHVVEQSPIWERYDGPTELVSVGTNVTASWADIGAEVDMRGYTKLGVWAVVDINDSENFRIRALGKHTSAGATEYVLPIRMVRSDVVDVDDEYFEFANDSDQNVFLEVDTTNLIHYVQLQIQAGVVGSTAGQIDNLTITKSWSAAGSRQSQKAFALDEAYDSVSQNVHVVEDRPLDSVNISNTLVDSTSISDGLLQYYVDMDGFRYNGTHIIMSCTAGQIDGYVYASLQDDGTAPASVTYSDITNDMFGVTTIKATASSSINDIYIIDTPFPVKYLKFEFALDAANTANVTVYNKKMF